MHLKGKHHELYTEFEKKVKELKEACKKSAELQTWYCELSSLMKCED